MIKEMKVKFKSKPVFYEKEKSGIKNNTVRVVDDNYFSYSEDSRFNLLSDIYKLSLENNYKIPEDIKLYIEIENKETGESFTRKVTDITIFENNFEMIFIITWEHEEV